jgi:hypothetical protein
MPSVEELQSAVTQSLEAAVDSMRFASELMARNTAQQQEIERLRGENAELLQENVRLLTPTHDEFRQLLAAQRKGERPVDLSLMADSIVRHLDHQDMLQRDLRCYAGRCKVVAQVLPIIERRMRDHLEPQGESHERDEVPVRDSAVLEPGVSVEPGVSGASAATAPQRERVEVACGDGRSMESVQAVAAQAVAPASPLRAEERCSCGDGNSGYDCEIHGWPGELRRSQEEAEQLNAELAALRKQVEEGERDTKRLDWLGTEVNFSLVDIVGVSKGSGLFNSNRQGTMRTLREALDAAMAATPEPKEPA